ncbi:MAG: CrcB family protein [Alphaproteobacteria bacterium]|jgi:CrcB protein|nr:CrcB family protein [Alphaproteobacteria bacterium]
MLNLLIIFFGGGLGSVSRYAISLLFITQKSLATLLVNIIGCFLIAIIDSLLKKYNINFFFSSPQTRLLFITGFLGGFTTYSSFLLDFFNHLHANQSMVAVLYIFFSIVLGLGAFLLGLEVAKFF